jgi:hypothetical protein
MKFRILAALAAAGTIAVAAAGPALAINPPTLDQHHECAAADCTLGTSNVPYPVWLSPQTPVPDNSPVGMAQTFTPSVTGPLSKVELYLKLLDSSGTPAPFDVVIVPLIGGIPHPATPLATQTVPTPVAGTSPWGAIGSAAWIPVTFTTPATLTAGTKYAIVVGWQLPGGSWLSWEADASYASPYTDYVGGDAMVGTHVSIAYNFYDLFQSPVLSDSQTGNADFAFRTYVGAAATPTPTAAPRVTVPPTDASMPADPAQPSSGLPLLVLAIAGLAGLAVLLTPKRNRFSNRP